MTTFVRRTMMRSPSVGKIERQITNVCANHNLPGDYPLDSHNAAVINDVPEFGAIIADG
jgi:hypothetical protein